MPKNVEIPVKEYVREYLLHQYGKNPIFLPETNALSVLLREVSDKKKFNVAQYNPELYCCRVNFVSEVNLPGIEPFQIIKLNHFIELQIKVMVYFRVKTSVNNLKDVILDVMAENNFPVEKYNSLKSYIYSLNNYANELRETA